MSYHLQCFSSVFISTFASSGTSISPLKNFFLQGDKFWQEPVDVRLKECQNTCAKLYKQKTTPCFKLPEGRERKACLEAIDVSDCFTQCQDDLTIE